MENNRDGAISLQTEGGAHSRGGTDLATALHSGGAHTRGALYQENTVFKEYII